MEKMTVLIVDDALFMRTILRRMFERDGRCDIVGEAVNGYEAIEKAELLQPDIITMDIVMPDLDGMEAIEIIKEKSPKSKIVMMTSVTNYQMIDKAKAKGAYDYLPKPVNSDDINILLNKILSNQED